MTSIQIIQHGFSSIITWFIKLIRMFAMSSRDDCPGNTSRGGSLLHRISQLKHKPYDLCFFISTSLHVIRKDIIRATAPFYCAIFQKKNYLCFL